MFDLEKAIAAWRRTLEHTRAVTAEDLRELEAHVRDQVEWLQAEGCTEEAAFAAALRDVGDVATTEAEYHKVFWAKARHQRRLGGELMHRMDLFRNALKISYRNMAKAKGFTFLNVLGLAVGLACCVLIALYVQDELRYDRFHAEGDRMYRLVWDARLPDGTTWYGPITPAPMAEAVRREVPEVDAITRLRVMNGAFALRYEERALLTDRMFYADSTFFSVFTFPLRAGDPTTALTAPQTVVVTESGALRYFGKTDVMGQTLDIDGVPFRVTGVAADVPAASHLHFDLVASMSSLGPNVLNDFWFSNNFYTYLLLKDDTPPGAVEAKLEGVVQTHLSAQLMDLRGVGYDDLLEAGGRWRYELQPLADIHLRSHTNNEIEPNGHIAYVYGFSLVALIILLLACINFTNLSTSRAALRAREVGLHKVLGSHRRQVAGRFLVEALLLAGLATAVAVALVLAALPAFNGLAGKALTAASLAQPLYVAGLPLLAVLVGVAAGAYPAFVLSRFRPAEVLKGGTLLQGGGRRLRGALVVFQFTLTIALIACTLIVYRQVGFMQGKALGFDKEHVFVVERTQVLGNAGAAFKEEVARLPGVTAAAYISHVPGRGTGDNPFTVGASPDGAVNSLRTVYADFDLVAALGLQMKAGRAFSSAFGADASAVLLNEAAVRAMGLENPVGQQITRVGLADPSQSTTFTVIGVVEDFHYASLHEPILPLALLPTSFSWRMAVRLGPGDVRAAVDRVKGVWEAAAPGEPFSYAFLDRDLDALYASEHRTGRLFGVAALLAILVACLGLFGLASLTAVQRTKEVGIRKALGASVTGLVALLSKDFLRLVGVAFVLAAPLAYVLMDRWLAGFAYRVGLSGWTFVLTGLAALALTLVAVGYQALRTATADPVQTLRYE